VAYASYWTRWRYAILGQKTSRPRLSWTHALSNNWKTAGSSRGYIQKVSRFGPAEPKSSRRRIPYYRTSETCGQ
jgi:hypothetical protein